ncbi:3122_t:CDS:2 [Rhizophagus irregularis]|nr:3122_t:CDS:2 [Rhizophagus irregularis]
MELQQYNFLIQHHAEKANSNADSLFQKRFPLLCAYLPKNESKDYSKSEFAAIVVPFFIAKFEIKNGTYGIYLTAATSYILSLIYPTKNNGTCIAPILQFLLVFPVAVDDLFEFKLFAKIHKKLVSFDGIQTLLIGDLAQLPPVNGKQVFHTPE